MVRSAKKTDLSANTTFNSFTWNNIYNQNILQNEYTKIILIETEFFKISGKFIKKKNNPIWYINEERKEKIVERFHDGIPKTKKKQRIKIF